MFTKHSLSEGKELLNQGIQHLEVKKYDKALVAFERALVVITDLALKKSLDKKEDHRNILLDHIEKKLLNKCLELKDFSLAKRCCSVLYKYGEDNIELLKHVASTRHTIYLTERGLQSNTPKTTTTKNEVLLSEVKDSKVKDAKQTSAIVTPEKKSDRLNIENLGFQGGGIKGVAYLGALQALSKYVDLTQVKRFMGTSAGAITAVLLGVGFSLPEIQQFLENTPFSDFMDGKYSDSLLKLIEPKTQATVKEKAKEAKAIFGLFQGSALPHQYISGSSQASSLISDPHVALVKEGIKQLTAGDNGLFPGEMFRNWIEERIQERTGQLHLTFAELHKLATEKPSEGYRDIYLVGANISSHAPEVFCHEDQNTCNAIISDALRISISIPLVFTPCQLYIKDEGGVRIEDYRQCWYVDGGLVDNYPLSLFDKPKYLPKNEMLQNANVYGIVNPHSLGFRLVSAEHKAQHEGESKATGNSKAPKELAPFLLDVLMTVYKRQEVLHVERHEVARTIYIDHLGISPVQFNLSEQEQIKLIESGFKAVIDYFEKKSGLKAQPLPEIQETTAVAPAEKLTM